MIDGVDIIKIQITPQMSKEAKRFAKFSLRDRTMRRASDSRGFEPDFRLKCDGMLGELAIRKLLKSHNIDYEIDENCHKTDSFDIKVGKKIIEIKTKHLDNMVKLDNFYLLVPKNQIEPHKMKGITHYVLCTIYSGRVWIIGQVSSQRFYADCHFAEPGERLSGGWKLTKVPAYWMVVNELVPIKNLIGEFLNKHR